ncbi:hypothetical protein [Glycomyces salinus]|uniref:hypothetical protein n=1 Tax=Glycomyces salinus TaxID=980294 RepID=UPI0018EA608B|nr:hypothetical protein [Glycomyces salinus]
MNLEFGDIYEMEMLAKTLNHVKFFEERPIEDPFMASPILANVHRRLIWSIIEVYEKELRLQGPAARWLEWLEWDGRYYEPLAVVKYASDRGDWDQLDQMAKFEVLRNCCSPFEPNDTQLSELCGQIDEKRRASGVY